MSGIVSLFKSCRAQRSLCSQISTGGYWNAKHTGLFLQRKEFIIYPRSLGADVCLIVWRYLPDLCGQRPGRILPQTLINLFFLSQSIKPIFMVFTKTFSAVMSCFNSSKRFTFALLWMQIWVNYHQNRFLPNSVCLTYAPNKYVPLNPVEPDCLPAFHRSSLCRTWSSQRPLQKAYLWLWMLTTLRRDLVLLQSMDSRL